MTDVAEGTSEKLFAFAQDRFGIGKQNEANKISVIDFLNAALR
jgi:hypothetical protein